MTFRSFACGNRRSTRTTMVLAILLEMTLPTRCLRCPRTASVEFIVSAISSRFFWQLRSARAELGDARFHPRDVPAQRPQARRFLQLGARLLQTQVEHFMAQVQIGR